MASLNNYLPGSPGDWVKITSPHQSLLYVLRTITPVGSGRYKINIIGSPADPFRKDPISLTISPGRNFGEWIALLGMYTTVEFLPSNYNI
jgi:hypothetical protein